MAEKKRFEHFRPDGGRVVTTDYPLSAISTGESDTAKPEDKMDHSRDPCPWVIIQDFGGAFAMGAVGGAVWHGVKGYRNSPYGERRIGAITAIKARAPVLGGNFGVWGGLFNAYDCAVKGIRKKEDPWNAITAGFLTGGSLAVRGGYRSMRNGAISCGILLAVIEGVSIGFGRMMAQEGPLPPVDAAPPAGTGSMAGAA